MTDEEASNLFGLDDSSLGFVDDGSMPGDVKSNLSHSSNDDVFDSSGWDLPDANPFESYDDATTSASQVQSIYTTAAWDPSLLDQQQQTTTAEIDGLLMPMSSPPFMFGESVLPSDEQARTGYPSVQPMRHPVTTLTPALQEKLRNIAMPPHLQYHSPKSASSPESPTGEAKTHSSPEDASKFKSKKRKVLEEHDDDEDDSEEGKPVKKTSHNMIEKRYRNNLNDKIAALRDSVPSLRIMSKSARGEDTTEDREELHGLTPAHKLNKATVLSKATEYIRHMEKRYNRLVEENNTMRARIAAFEKLFMAGAMNGSIAPMQQQPPTPLQYSPQDSRQQYLASPLTASPESTTRTNGMIQVPDDMKRILAAQMAVGQPYPVPQQSYQQQQRSPNVISQQQIQQEAQMQQGRWSNAGPYFGKLMVGSLAGLVILEGLKEEEVGNEKTEGRGLGAVPIQLLAKIMSSLDFNVMGYHFHTSLKLLLLLGTVLWIFVPALFRSSEQKPKKNQFAEVQPAPSLASSIHVRRQAWLTAIQTVWIPRHNFFLEAAALILKAFKLSMRNVIGAHTYQMLSGVTEDQETSRVKVWSIAIDSQLAGGDVEINRSRLILTLLASGTLPDTPSRLMLKALHVRVLLWDLGRSGWQAGIVNSIAAKLAKSLWNEARSLNRLYMEGSQSSGFQHEDEMPEHLARLVEHECNDVLNNSIIQRAYNLAFNDDTTRNVEDIIDGMDAIVEDAAIGSPLDAVAAWWSTQVLHRALAATLDKSEEQLARRAENLDSAIQTAPIGSVAQVRAVVARAVIVNEKRGANIAAALQTVGADLVDSTLGKSMSLIDSASYSSCPDIRMSIQCAMAIAHLTRMENADKPDLLALRLAETIVFPRSSSTMSLLSCTAAVELMEKLFAHKEAAETFSNSLERLAGSLRHWVGGSSANKCGLTSEVRHKVVERCLNITKTMVGMEIDTGYGSLSDEEIA
jgi:hypothetical protein